jgi:hypothetical protein
LAAMGVGGRMAAASAGVVAVKAARGIVGFLAVGLTDMVEVPNRSNGESHLAATARRPRRLQRRGDSIASDEDLVDQI